jgi:hypothetical protein
VLGAMPLSAGICLHIVYFGIREGPDNMPPALESGYFWLAVADSRIVFAKRIPKILRSV